MNNRIKKKKQKQFNDQYHTGIGHGFRKKERALKRELHELAVKRKRRKNGIQQNLNKL